MFIKPDYNLKSIYDIDLDELQKQGIKAMLFDLDSTLMASKSGTYTLTGTLYSNPLINLDISFSW